MRRRKFIALLGSAAVSTWPVGRIAKSQEQRRVDVLMGYADTDVEPQSWIAALVDALQKLGWTDGGPCRFLR